MLDRGALSWELDHLLIWVAPEAPESSALDEAGLRHTGIAWPLLGRGTSAFVYMFENVYLALAWVDNPELAGLHAANPNLDVLGRSDWWRRGASPFGVGLRPCGEVPSRFPVPASDHPSHLVPAGGTLQVARQSEDKRQPLYYGVYPSFMGQGGAGRGSVLAQSMDHPLGARRLTGASLTVDAPRIGEAGEWLEREGILSVKAGGSPALELTFDESARGLYLDLRPTLPLKVHA